MYIFEGKKTHWWYLIDGILLKIIIKSLITWNGNTFPGEMRAFYLSECYIYWAGNDPDRRLTTQNNCSPVGQA